MDVSPMFEEVTAGSWTLLIQQKSRPDKRAAFLWVWITNGTIPV